MNSIRVTTEDPRSVTASGLIAELTAELAGLYSYAEDGTGAFKPEDVLVSRAAFVVAWHGDEAVGCGALRPMDDPAIGEVKRMYVRPAARGNGISRLILSTLEDLARGFNYRALMLETGNLQTQAIGLYESSGFQRTDCYGIYVGEPMSVCYEKVL